jgi:hypothetical protein
VSDNRARIWFSLFVLAVFCLGGASGFVAGRHVPRFPGFDGLPPPPADVDGRGYGLEGRGVRRGPPFGRGPGGAPPLPPNLMPVLSSELQLDASQQDQVKKILDERRGRLEQVHREARASFEKEQRELHAAIRALLRSDQQEKFDKFLEHRR